MLKPIARLLSAEVTGKPQGHLKGMDAEGEFLLERIAPLKVSTFPMVGWEIDRKGTLYSIASD